VDWYIEMPFGYIQMILRSGLKFSISPYFEHRLNGGWFGKHRM